MYPKTNAYCRSVCAVIAFLGLAGFASPVVAQGGTRDLSAYTEPGVPFTVSITLDVPDGTIALAVEDSPPPGWTSVANISNGGSYDSGNHKIKWGPHFSPFPEVLTFDITPPLTPGAGQCFEGVVNFNGTSEVDIEGDSCIPRLIPTVSAWGMIVLTLLLLTAGSLLFARRTHNHRA